MPPQGIKPGATSNSGLYRQRFGHARSPQAGGSEAVARVAASSSFVVHFGLYRNFSLHIQRAVSIEGTGQEAVPVVEIEPSNWDDIARDDGAGLSYGTGGS
ncbi:hypothetical protein PG994_014064 [Apiospora phragmitis]|uniref:Uncharacterized protein n=1 Tax=Apiospora phragmitis TaxID=2905665 RepID=A0ABR1T397_9PEZI